jgi:hypothetical protein
VRNSALCCFILLATASCDNGTEPEPSTKLTREQLLDPETCASCHSDHYQEWSGSMHAYAADDPVFLAMNARAQREANLGDFCVKCHAPMAVREGLTTDGSNLPDLPRAVKGVTCYFCHSAESVTGTHNSPIELSSDGLMRAAIVDALPNSAHGSAYADLLDRKRLSSSDLCGSCHDIQNQHGVKVERTFGEWKESAFSRAPGGTTCGQCHMPESKELVPVASVSGAKARRRHSHEFPAVDVALGEFPNQKQQRAAIQDLLDTSVQSALCVRGAGANKTLMVILDNVAAGHSFPSGVAHDRRAWVELVGYQAGEPVYQSGVVPAGTSPTQLGDPDLWLLRDCGYDDDGQHVEMFWDAKGVESLLLPGQQTFDPSDRRFYQTHVYRTYPRAGAALGVDLDRVELQLHLAPVGVDVVDSLIESGDLAPGIRERLTTFDVGARLVWTAATATETYIDQGIPMSCISTTNLRAAADKVPAPGPEHCSE